MASNDVLDIKEHVKELKGILNYFQPFIIWKEIEDNLKENKIYTNHNHEGKAKIYSGQDFEKILYDVMRTTRNYFCHLSCWTTKKYITHMHLNMKNLYEVCGVDLLMKTYQLPLLKNAKKRDEENNYYYYDYSPDFTDLKGNPPNKVSRNNINETIINIIKDKHKSPKTSMSDEKESIIIFAYIVHHLVGTRDLEWDNTTKYFDCYDFEKRADTNGTKKSLFLKRRDDIDDVEFNERFKRIKEQWKESEPSKSKIRDIKKMELRKMFNPEPFEVWNNLHKKLRKLDKCSDENKNIINILISTKKVLTGIYNFMDQKGRYRIYLNLRNLYNFFGINFKNEDEMRDFKTLVRLNLSLPEEEKKYYFYEWQSDRETNESHKKELLCETVNKSIKDSIESGYKAIDEGRYNPITGALEMDAVSENIILFGYLLHLFEGNSDSVTKYFSNFCIIPCEDGTKIQLKEATEIRKESRDKIKQDYDNLMKHLEKAIVTYK